MIWAILGLGIAVSALLSWIVVSFAVTVSKQSSNALATIIALDERDRRERDAYRAQMTGLIDRLMSQDWENVRLHESAQGVEGAFLSPEDQREEQEQIETRLQGANWGHASALKDFFSGDSVADAERLAAEDDLDGRDAELAQ
jgi:hypothetical protein